MAHAAENSGSRCTCLSQALEQCAIAIASVLETAIGEGLRGIPRGHLRREV